MPAIAESYFHNMSLEEWIDLIQEQIHLGSSYDEDYPLTTYVPINQAQKELIKTYYVTYHKTISSYIQFNELIGKLIQNIAELPTKTLFTFAERYPSYPYFLQAVCNQAHVFDMSTEIRPGRQYWPITPEQSALIQAEYESQSNENHLYSANDLSKFVQKIDQLGDKTGQPIADL